MGVQGNWEKRRVGTLEGLGAIDRRKFLALSGMSAAALVLGGGPLSEKTMARPLFRDDPFSLGVASGDPLPDGVVIWTRLAPDPLAKDGSGGMPARKFRCAGKWLPMKASSR
jgi:alkaline phosphatase D